MPKPEHAKIMLIASNFPPVRGGSSSVYSNIAKHVASRIVVLAPIRDYSDGLPLIGWREFDRRAAYIVYRLPLLRTTLTGSPPMPKYRWRLWDAWLRARVLARVVAAILRHNVRVVCVGELMAGAWLLHVLRFFRNIKKIAYVHGEEITTAAENQQERERARRHLMACDKIIVVSAFTASATTQLIGLCAQSKICLIQNGVDIERFTVGPRSRALTRTYNLQEMFVFVSVSRLVEKKGHDKSILSLRRVVEEFPDTRLLIVGDGPYRSALDSLVERLSLRDYVVFAGAVAESELADHYRLGDVFIMPNRALPNGDTEGFGLVFLEAGACGLPVIAGQDGGSVEAVKHGFNGIVVDGNSQSAIEGAMLSLRRDEKLRNMLGSNGVHRANEFGWRSQAEMFLSACSE